MTHQIVLMPSRHLLALRQWADRSIDELGLSQRASDALLVGGIRTVGELLQRFSDPAMLYGAVPSLNRSCQREIVAAVRGAGIGWPEAAACSGQSEAPKLTALDLIADELRCRGYEIERDGAACTVCLARRGRPCRVRAHQSDAYVHCRVHFPFHIPACRRPAFCEMVARLNWTRSAGRFELNLATGEAAFSLVHPSRRTDLATDRAIEDLPFLAMRCIEEHIDVLAAAACTDEEGHDCAGE